MGTLCGSTVRDGQNGEDGWGCSDLVSRKILAVPQLGSNFEARMMT